VYDNAVLGHRDRSRIVPPEIGSALPLSQESTGSVLIDGFVGARWQLRRERPKTSLHVDLLREVPPAMLAETEAEATGLLAFLAPDADPRIEIRRARAA
jgi:hypothetical protein